jgi:hypothetical protein
MNDQGLVWRVSDFITLGSPLTHAEFLMAADMEALRLAQTQRELPTCPPVPEWKQGADEWQLVRRPKGSCATGTSPAPIPHHAALFAFTRWTNLFSRHRFVAQGDIVSGPLGPQFWLAHKGCIISGIRDIAVMPGEDGSGAPLSGMERRLFTHNNYWLTKGTAETGLGPDAVPQLLRELRKALRLDG